MTDRAAQNTTQYRLDGCEMPDRPTAPAQAWWHPEAYARRRPRLKARGAITAAVRRYLLGAGFVEVETPALQRSPGVEVHLGVFATDWTDSDPTVRRRRYLHTSPEFAMKKLLVAGEPRVFQFARVFRNGERSATHHPEFTMLEWYRADADYTAAMADCVGVVRAALAAGGTSVLRHGDRTCDPTGPWQRLTVADAFTRLAGIDLLATASDPGLLAAAARRAGVVPHDGDRWDDIVFRVMFERIEPALGDGAPTLLIDYPVAMAALARVKPGDPRVAERFELYAAGVELANGYSELTDPAEQRARFVADMDLRAALYGDRLPVDDDFLAALDYGLPASAGVALGFDRLVMLCTGAATIEDVLWAPVR